MAGELIVHTRSPLNAETPLHLLSRSALTPNARFFVRCHGPLPAIDAERYCLRVDGDVAAPLALGLDELSGRFPRTTVVATIACAGNRRRELGRPAALAGGIPWDAGAIGTAAFAGVPLAAVLAAAGVGREARHVAFEGLDRPEVDGRPQPFGGSVPIEKALAPEVLLAFEMNGEPLPAEHGFPVRALVPGYVGARSVKWLARVRVQREPSESYFQRTDYTFDGVPLGEAPLNSAVCRPAAGSHARGSTIEVEGYAVGGSRAIDRVEVSGDAGRTWSDATLDEDPGGPWAWRLWRARVDVAPESPEIVVRAVDAAGEVQSATVPPGRNAGGYMMSAWHRVALADAPR